jgi:ABC-type polysaccharide/polyol phosphate export permease
MAENILESTNVPTPVSASGPGSGTAEMRVLVPVKRRVRFSDVWMSWPLAYVTAARDLKVKYKQSLVGPAWLVIQPLGNLAGLTVVFAGVADVKTGGVPYPLFALVGMTIWTFFQLSVATGTMAIAGNSTLIRRVACRRFGFVTSSLLSSLLAPSVIFVAALAGLVISGDLKMQALLFPVVFAGLFIFAGALLLILASVTVRYRDATALLPFMFQAGIFLSPAGR